MTHENGHTNLHADDVQLLENVIDDAKVSGLSRRALLGTAAAAAAAAAVPGVAFARGSADSAKEIGTAAVTAEALAVTYLSNLIQKAGGAFPAKVGAVLKAANTAEEEHYEFLSGAGFTPLTKQFWIPNLAFEAKAAPAVIEYFESIFVNAYLIGTTAFAKAGQADLARYTVEIGAVEAEHLALARSLQKELPNNIAFTSYTVKSIGEIVQAIQNVGVGFGKATAAPGAFYTYSGPLPGTTTMISSKKPQ